MSVASTNQDESENSLVTWILEHTVMTVDGEVFMPFKSQAQRRKFAQLLMDGKISNETFEEWNRETGSKKLPERVGSKSKKARATRSTGRRRAAKKQ